MHSVLKSHIRCLSFIFSNACFLDGNLVTADGRLLTNADGTPMSVTASEAGQLLGPAGDEPENILPTTEHEVFFSSSKVLTGRPLY